MCWLRLQIPLVCLDSLFFCIYLLSTLCDTLPFIIRDKHLGALSIDRADCYGTMVAIVKSDRLKRRAWGHWEDDDGFDSSSEIARNAKDGAQIQIHYLEDMVFLTVCEKDALKRNVLDEILYHVATI